jgi:adenylyltransferase/sulfurtransferase
VFVVTGRLGIVDYDDVELGNLHRQILHSENGVGVNKASSAAASLNRLNSKVTCVTHHVLLDSSNAMAIIKEYDVIVDATDNVATRHNSAVSGPSCCMN